MAAVAPVAASDVLFAPEKLCLFRFIPMDLVPSYAFTFHGLVLHSFPSAINAPPLLYFSLNRMYQIIMTLRNVLHSAIAPFCLSPPWWLLPKLDRDVMITHSLQTKQRESEEYGWLCVCMCVYPNQCVTKWEEKPGALSSIGRFRSFGADCNIANCAHNML